MPIRYTHGEALFGRIAGLDQINGRAGSHLVVRTVDDGKTVRLNNRNYVQASGSSIGFQTKPNQTVLTTGDVIGGECSPRYAAGIAGGSLIALRADPVLKAGAGNLSGNAIALECNLDFGVSGTRTITGKVAAIRAFLAVPSTYTYTGKKAVIVVATPNIAGWDYLVDAEASSGVFDGTNGTYTTADGFFKVRVPEGDARVPYYLGVD